MLAAEPQLLALEEVSQVASARRAVDEAAAQARFNATDRGRMAIVATELAGNVVKHAGGGWLAVRALDAEPSGVEVLAIDSGPGMNLGASMRDGFSTTGTPGEGLGAVQRLSEEFEVYSERGRGTVAVARRFAAKREGPRPAAVGMMSSPRPGSPVNGDAWSLLEVGQGLLLTMVDGLGHGPLAAEAAIAAIELVASHRERPPAAILEMTHAALHHTRGAALAICRLEPAQGELRFAGLGNVAGRLLGRGAVDDHHLLSHNGTAGREVRSVEEYRHAIAPGALLVLHTDGIGGRWRLDDHPGLAAADPALIAALLWRDHRRGDDDATAVVVRLEASR